MVVFSVWNEIKSQAKCLTFDSVMFNCLYISLYRMLFFFSYILSTKPMQFCDCNFLQLHNVLYGDAKGWFKRTCSFLHPYVLGVVNPDAKIVRGWNKFFVISCMVAVFVDPLFFFLLSAREVCFSSFGTTCWLIYVCIKWLIICHNSWRALHSTYKLSCSLIYKCFSMYVNVVSPPFNLWVFTFLKCRMVSA